MELEILDISICRGYIELGFNRAIQRYDVNPFDIIPHMQGIPRTFGEIIAINPNGCYLYSLEKYLIAALIALQYERILFPRAIIFRIIALSDMETPLPIYLLPIGIRRRIATAGRERERQEQESKGRHKSKNLFHIYLLKCGPVFVRPIKM